MTIADLFLRFGINVSTWLVAFVYLLFLLLIPKASCGSEVATDPWTATTVLGLVLLPLLALMSAARSHMHPFRWLSVLPVMMAVAGLLVVLPYLDATTLGGAELCSVRTGSPSGAASSGARGWAPFQLLLIALIAWRATQAWRAPE